MGKWKKPKGREKRWNRAALIKRDGMICWLCQDPIASMAELTIDHIVPESRGGTDELKNMRLAHAFCNQQRSSGFFAKPYPPEIVPTKKRNDSE